MLKLNAIQGARRGPGRVLARTVLHRQHLNHSIILQVQRKGCCSIRPAVKRAKITLGRHDDHWGPKLGIWSWAFCVVDSLTTYCINDAERESSGHTSTMHPTKKLITRKHTIPCPVFVHSLSTRCSILGRSLSNILPIFVYHTPQFETI